MCCACVPPDRGVFSARFCKNEGSFTIQSLHQLLHCGLFPYLGLLVNLILVSQVLPCCLNYLFLSRDPLLIPGAASVTRKCNVLPLCLCNCNITRCLSRPDVTPLADVTRGRTTPPHPYSNTTVCDSMALSYLLSNLGPSYRRVVGQLRMIKLSSRT